MTRTTRAYNRIESKDQWNYHPYLQGRGRSAHIAGMEKFRPRWKREQSKKRRRADANGLRMTLWMERTGRSTGTSRGSTIFDEWHID